MEDTNESLVSELTQEDVDAMGDGLFDGWDDDLIAEDADTSEEEVKEIEEEAAEDEDESDEADQPEEEAEDEAEKPDDPKKEEKPDEETDKTSQKSYTFTHLDDDPITLTPDEMVPYVNKGLDYDRIRKERDAMKANYPKYEMYAEFLDRIKGKFDSIEDLMDDTDATLLVKNEADNGRTLTKEDAIKRVKANREEKFKSIVPPKGSDEKPKEQEDSPRSAGVKAFVKDFNRVFPNEKIPAWEELPPEVQSEFERTGELSAPYFAWRLSQKDNEIKTIKNNQKSKERSTGSRRSKGKAQTLDPIFEGFGDE